MFYTLLTDIGQAKIANAIALGTSIDITELAVGDGNGVVPDPDSSMEALVNEVRRAAINTSDVDPDNPSWIVVEQIIPPDVGGWTIREIGIFDVDGDLIGYGNYPETFKPTLDQGSSRTQTVRFVLEVSDTAAVTLKVDPSVVLATREYVDNKTPAADAETLGLVELATNAEAQALADATRALTPGSLAAAFNGANSSMATNGYQKLPGGLIVQWGFNIVVSEGTFALPVAFPNNFFVAISSQNNHFNSPDDSTDVWAVAGAPSGLTSIKLMVKADSSDDGVFWLAIGN